MPSFPEIPLNVRAVYKNDGSAKSAFLSEVDSMVDGGLRKFREFSDEASRQLDAALSVKRNSSGSLDLNVEGMRAAVVAQQARAAAAREIATATALAAREEQDYSQKARLAVAATEALAREEEEAAQKTRAHADALEQVQDRLNRTASATDVVVQANRRGTTETGNVINGLRAQRVAFTQLGQQMQDVTVQMQMGTGATTIFTQQVPQMAFALSGLEGNANATLDKIGQFASFLSGPWGAALFAATAVLGPYIASLLASGDAAEEAQKALDKIRLSAFGLKDAQQALGGVFDLTTGRMTEQTGAALALAKAQIILAQATAQKNLADARRTITDSASKRFQISGGLGGGFSISRETPITAQVESQFRNGVIDGNGAIESLRRMQQAGKITMTQFAELAAAYANAGVETRNLKTLQEAEASLLTGKLNPALREAGKSRRSQGSSGGPDPAKASERLASFGDRAAEAIQRINERFNEQPKFIDAAAQATRELDGIIAQLEKRQPAGFKDMIADAQAAKQVVQDALVKPFAELTRDTERRVQLQALVLAGSEAEANALRDIWQYQQQYGEMTEQQVQATYALAAAEEKVSEVLRRRKEIQSAYLDATQQIRSQLENLFSGESVNFGRIFRQLKSRIMVENIFGDVLRDMDRYIRKSTGVDDAVEMLRDQTIRSGDSLSSLADVVDQVTVRLGSAGSGFAFSSSGASTGGLAGSILSGVNFTGQLASLAGDARATTDAEFGASNDNQGSGDIVVKATREGVRQGLVASRGALTLTPEQFFEKMTRSLMGPLEGGLKEIFGSAFFGKLTGILSGAAYGQATAGTPGAILGALKGIEGLPEGLTAALDKGLGGAQTGTAVAGIGNALGIKLNTTGAQIGGAIGSFIPIPGGQIIGSIAGGLLGNLFKKVKSGYAQVRDGVVAGTYGRDTELQGQASTLAGGLIDQFKAIADRLGLTLGKFSFDIGSKDGKFAFTPATGVGANVTQWFTEQQDAITAALKSVISNGAFEGMSEAVKRLLSNGDIEVQLEKALKFQDVFTRLKSYTDPAGAALEALNKEFSDLKAIFAEAGASAAEYAQLEQLYGLERAKTIKSAIQQVSGSLRGLLDDLTVNNDALSLRSRESMARAAFDPLAARVAAGDVTAFDDFATASRTLLDVSRQIYGSQEAYFDLNKEITGLTQTALDRQQALVDAATKADSPFANSPAVTDNASVEAAVRDQTETMSAYMRAMNDNLATLIAQGALAGGSSGSGATGYW